MKANAGFCPRRRGLQSPSGFALPAAIFILVVLSLMAGFILHVSTHQQVGHAADLRGTRAYQAARAGIEWGLFSFLRNSGCANVTSFSPGGNLAEFTVTVQCLPTAGDNDENGTTLVVRRIVATACSQPSAGTCPNNAPAPNYIERQLAVVTGRSE